MAVVSELPHNKVAARSEVHFPAEDGVILRAWFYLPPDAASKASRGAKTPAITMAHGFGATRGHGLDRFARVFAASGFAVLVHDHRNFGASDGELRHDIDPWRQIEDWRRAVSFLRSRPEVDQDRIGIWGSSYAGGHAIVLGATDRRLKCVVAQVPTIDGYEQGLRRVAPADVAALDQAFSTDDDAVFGGAPRRRLRVASIDPAEPAVFRDQAAVAFYTSPGSENWANEVTHRSIRLSRSYQPGTWIARVSPTPLLLIVAMADTVTATDLALRGFESALQPKHLVMLQGGHFDPYDRLFDEASTAAAGWFSHNLRSNADSAERGLP